MTLFSLEEPDAVDPTFSVGELVDRINGALRRDLGVGVWVRGEIQGWNERGAHAYFRLVEDGAQGKAALNAQLFAPTRTRLRPLLERHRLRLADGVQVRVFGKPELYGPTGQLGLKISDLDPAFTLGDLAARRDALLRQLAADGRYDANRSRTLPAAPLRLGVVTSTSSAAWADFVHEIERSRYGFQIQVIDVRVQGGVAPSQISRAIDAFGRRVAPDGRRAADAVDVVVLIRGGGSRTELATFDDEAIATAIARCPVPVFTGLGHEIDRSIADEVAHRALKTPTACAAALAERVSDFLTAIDGRWSNIVVRASAAIDRSAVQWERDVRRLTTQSERVTTRADARLDTAVDALARVPRRLEAEIRELDAAVVQLARAPRRLDAELRHLDGIAAQVRLADPVHVLARGWTITRTADGRVVRDPADVSIGDLLVTSFAHGTTRSRVEQLQPQAANAAATTAITTDPAHQDVPHDH